jgi:hypothetical protein
MRKREQMSRFANLADKPKVTPNSHPQTAVSGLEERRHISTGHHPAQIEQPIWAQGDRCLLLARDVTGHARLRPQT